jgi:hypothetical protein
MIRITSFLDRRISARIEELVKKERQACLDICTKIVDENQIIESWNWSAKRAINAIEARNNQGLSSMRKRSAVVV